MDLLFPDVDPNLDPVPVKSGVTFLEVARDRAKVVTPVDVLVLVSLLLLLVVSPTGACSNNCLGKRQEQQIPISASRLTYGGMDFPKSAQQSAFAK